MLRPPVSISPRSILGAICLLVSCIARAESPISSSDAQNNSPGIERTYHDANWCIVETANFQICCRRSDELPRQLAARAERLRSELQAEWLGKDDADTAAFWRPKCQIVLHTSLSSYVAAVGRGSEHTVGSSLVDVHQGRITNRRIDLLAAGSASPALALPHELTHVLLKDVFPTSVIPPWADEGAAILADATDKQARHRRDFAAAVEHHAAFETAALLGANDYPAPDRVGIFYGQSASLVRYLVDRGGPRQFVDFLACAETQGYDTALRDCYGLRDVGALDHAWSREVQLASGNGSRLQSPEIIASAR